MDIFTNENLKIGLSVAKDEAERKIEGVYPKFQGLCRRGPFNIQASTLGVLLFNSGRFKKSA